MLTPDGTCARTGAEGVALQAVGAVVVESEEASFEARVAAVVQEWLFLPSGRARHSRRVARSVERRLAGQAIDEIDEALRELAAKVGGSDAAALQRLGRADVARLQANVAAARQALTVQLDKVAERMEAMSLVVSAEHVVGQRHMSQTWRRVLKRRQAKALKAAAAAAAAVKEAAAAAAAAEAAAAAKAAAAEAATAKAAAVAAAAVAAAAAAEAAAEKHSRLAAKEAIALITAKMEGQAAEKAEWQKQYEERVQAKLQEVQRLTKEMRALWSNKAVHSAGLLVDMGRVEVVESNSEGGVAPPLFDSMVEVMVCWKEAMTWLQVPLSLTVAELFRRAVERLSVADADRAGLAMMWRGVRLPDEMTLGEAGVEPGSLQVELRLLTDAGMQRQDESGEKLNPPQPAAAFALLFFLLLLFAARKNIGRVVSGRDHFSSS